MADIKIKGIVELKKERPVDNAYKQLIEMW